MDTYSAFREFADSWMLLALTLFYIAACLWAVLPSRRRANEEAAGIPFRNDRPQPGVSDDHTSSSSEDAV